MRRPPARVRGIQDRTFELRGRTMDAVVALIGDLAAARQAGRSDADLAAARALHRQAQFYLDFIEAENSMGFHASGEAARILATSIDLARQGQLALLGVAPRPPTPAPAAGSTPPPPAAAPPVAPTVDAGAAPPAPP